MNKKEFNKLKTGDTVYKVSPLSSVYYKANVLEKGVVTVKLMVKGNMQESIIYSNIFTTEEGAKQEIIRRLKDSIMTKVSSIRRLMVNLYTFDNASLDDKLLSSVIEPINKDFNILKTK